ncbi:MAG TPA: hypothetical protein VF905_03240 [Nitrospirota bacterium]
MHYSSFFFEGLLILIIIGFIVRNFGLQKKNSKLKLEKWQQESYYQTLLHQNEVLRSYMDNRHMVWNIELTPRALETLEGRDSVVVLMNGQEVLEIWNGRYNVGYQAGLEASGTVTNLKKPEGPINNVIQLQFAFDDRRYDSDFREFVNGLTAIAVRFKDTQQLRSRISSFVFNFREYLKKRQAGQKPTFPNKE